MAIQLQEAFQQKNKLMKKINIFIAISILFTNSCSSAKDKAILAQIKEMGIEQYVEDDDIPIEVVTIGPQKKLIRTIKSSIDLKIGVTLANGYELSNY